MRDLRNNLIISGLDADDADAETETTTAEMVTDFFTQTMKIGTPIPLDSATRIGKSEPRTVLVRLTDAKDKGSIFKHAKNLKDVKNNKDQAYYVNNQLTPRLQEEQRWFRQLRRMNANLTGTRKREMNLKNGKLYVDSVEYKPSIHPPPIGEAVFPLDLAHVNKMQLIKGDVQNKGRCHFVGYAVKTETLADVRAAYTRVKRDNPNALHIACGYRLPGVDFVSLRGVADDGEHGAGRTIYGVLEDQNTFGVALYVVRYYGNKHIGPVRFQLISAAAKTALTRLKSLPTQDPQSSNPQGYAQAASPAHLHHSLINYLGQRRMYWDQPRDPGPAVNLCCKAPMKICQYRTSGRVPAPWILV